MKNLKNSINIIALLILISSCKTSSDTDASSSVKEVKPVEKVIKKVEVEVVKKAEVKIAKKAEVKIGKDNIIYFDLNSSNLTSESKKSLIVQSLWIKSTSPKSVLIQGHCDERGSKSYNLALGKRRALAVKQFLIDSGIDSKILNVISYGEDRPAVSGKGEKVWSQNRRSVTTKVD